MVEQKVTQPFLQRSKFQNASVLMNMSQMFLKNLWELGHRRLNYQLENKRLDFYWPSPSIISDDWRYWMDKRKNPFVILSLIHFKWSLLQIITITKINQLFLLTEVNEPKWSYLQLYKCISMAHYMCNACNTPKLPSRPVACVSARNEGRINIYCVMPRLTIHPRVIMDSQKPIILCVDTLNQAHWIRMVY